MLAFKKFFKNEKGELCTLFVDNAKTIPANSWLDASIPFHFTALNGKEYVPTRKSGKGGKSTGSSIKIPNADIKKKLVELGYCTKKAKSVKCVAYRPGWHCGSLPYFPQGGRKDNAAPYGKRHEFNAVFCIVEINEQKDWTYTAQNQKKCFSKKGKFMPKKADFQELKKGFYYYSTNPMNKEVENWIITDKIRIVRELSRKEVNNIMKNAGMAAQLWEA